MSRKTAITILLCMVSLFSYEISINQIGYDKEGSKKAVITNGTPSEFASFSIVSVNSNNSLYSGNLEKIPTPDGWSGYYQVADFSDFKTPGSYKIRVGSEESYPFSIEENLLFNSTAELMLDYFKGMRCTIDDKSVGFEGAEDKRVDLDGGWYDAAGDPGKHLSHLSYANYFNPQQQPLPVWTMLKSYEKNKSIFSSMQTKLFNEAVYGAEYLMKSLDNSGFFYTSVFDGWGFSDSRTICEWSGLEGTRYNTFKAGMREGAGLSIAALALASRLNVDPAQSSSWLTGAKKAYTHLKQHNNSYINDGNENIIDDYCGLLAAAELYRADGDILYKNDVSERAERIIAKQSDEGWFYSDDQRTRLFYHAAEEGLVLIALAEAVSVTQNSSYKNALKKARDWYVSATRDGKNPFDYVPLQYTPLSGSVNYASNSSVQASSEAVWGTNPASHAVDGDNTTSWNSEPGWDNSDTLDTITVDLETIEALTKIAINWGDEYATNFTVEVSTDGISWSETGQFTWRSGGVEQISFDEQDVRFIRVICQRWYWYEVWEGQWQSPMFYSIKEITAYGAPETDRSSSFFMPHDNETGYWWQGENARLGSMSAGLVWAELTLKNELNPTDTVSEIAQAQLDWILGKNTEGICMMTGRGTQGYPTYKAQYGIPNVIGGICNGITGDDDRGGKSPYYFMDTTKSSSWRWIEQWLPHSSWYLMGLSSLQQMKSGSTPILNEKSSSVKAGTVSLRNIGKSVSLNAAFVNGKNSSVELYDYRGRQIFSKAINSAGITKLDLSHVSHGMYVIRIMNNGSIMKSQHLRLM